MCGFSEIIVLFLGTFLIVNRECARTIFTDVCIHILVALSKTTQKLGAIWHLASKHLGLFWNLIFFPEFYVFLWNWTESWSSYVILIKFLRSKRDINFLSWTKYVQPCFEAQPRRGTLQLSSGSTLPCGSFTVFFSIGWNKINKLPIRRYPWFPCH